ncbi:MAG: hypothetical protein QXJ75_03585 [Candidatus Bathyarchaeia archaeon]
MGKILLLVAWLIDEADKETNESLAEEIERELKDASVQIPWVDCSRIEKVMVIDAQTWEQG